MALHDYFPGLKIIRYVSAPCSTGKTTAACRYIAERYCLHNYLYVAPTRQLVDQTFEVLRGRGLDPIKITGDTDPKRVKAEIIPILGEVEDVGLRMLLVTWSAFITLRFFPNRDIWLPVVDEVPQVDEFYPLMLPRNQRFLTEYLTVAATDHAKLGMVMPKDRKHLKPLMTLAIRSMTCSAISSAMCSPRTSSSTWICRRGTASLPVRRSSSSMR